MPPRQPCLSPGNLETIPARSGVRFVRVLPLDLKLTLVFLLPPCPGPGSGWTTVFPRFVPRPPCCSPSRSPCPRTEHRERREDFQNWRAIGVAVISGIDIPGNCCSHHHFCRTDPSGDDVTATALSLLNSDPASPRTSGLGRTGFLGWVTAEVWEVWCILIAQQPESTVVDVRGTSTNGLGHSHSCDLQSIAIVSGPGDCLSIDRARTNV